MFAVGIAIVLGAVFYGLNNSSINQAGTSSTAQNATPATPRRTPHRRRRTPPDVADAAPPGMRDVTPHANTDAGVTTGAAPARPATPPSAAPTGKDAESPRQSLNRQRPGQQIGGRQVLKHQLEKQRVHLYPLLFCRPALPNFSHRCLLFKRGDTPSLSTTKRVNLAYL